MMFRRVKNTILGILFLGGLGFLGQNFSFVPKTPLAQKLTTSLPAQIQKELVGKEKSSEPPTKRYVRIEGQYFEYNPRNVYMVKGVPTYYIDGARKEQPLEVREAPAEIEDSQEPSHRDKVQEMAAGNPLGVYTPQGMTAIVKEASRLRDDMNKRNRELKDLDP